ncbi:Hypothetical protein NGAL_HAMBI490_35780 [Neorhizobium galegae bv. officinalis]|nr:Hypothetical protein NGAL_HAMBI490_35780 [Neorhizobium galegae bv. officinalis]
MFCIVASKRLRSHRNMESRVRWSTGLEQERTTKTPTEALKGAGGVMVYQWERRRTRRADVIKMISALLAGVVVAGMGAWCQRPEEGNAAIRSKPADWHVLSFTNGFAALSNLASPAQHWPQSAGRTTYHSRVGILDVQALGACRRTACIPEGSGDPIEITASAPKPRIGERLRVVPSERSSNLKGLSPGTSPASSMASKKALRKTRPRCTDGAIVA